MGSCVTCCGLTQLMTLSTLIPKVGAATSVAQGTHSALTSPDSSTTRTGFNSWLGVTRWRNKVTTGSTTRVV